MGDGKNARTGDKAFGLRLRRQRESKGLSQARLGAKVNLTQNSISEFETGDAMPAAKTTLPALAAALETSVDYLLNGVGADVANEVETLLRRVSRKTWRKLGKMTPSELAQVARQLEALVDAQAPTRPEDTAHKRRPRRS